MKGNAASKPIPAMQAANFVKVISAPLH